MAARREGTGSRSGGRGASTHFGLEALRLRGARIVTVWLVVAVSLAGCAGSKTDTDAQPEALPGELAVRVMSGELAVRNARVSVLGTDLFGDTRADGSIRFTGLLAGSYDVAVQAPSFLPETRSVQVLPGAVSNLSVALRLDPSQPENPHIHDLWRGQPTYTMMDATIDITRYPPSSRPFTPVEEPLGGMVLRPNGVSADDSFFIPLVDDAVDAVIVLPGTRAMDITLSWEPSRTGFDAVSVAYNPPNGNAGRTDMFGPGQTVTIDVDKAWWDDGHRTFSRWMLRGHHNNQFDQPTSWTPVVVTDGRMDVQIVLHRGELELDAAHPDLWKGASELVLRQSSGGAGGAPVGVSARSPETGFRLDKDKIVPPDARLLRVEFRWYHNTADGYGVREDYELTWRTAAQNPQTTDIREFHHHAAIEGSAAAQYKIYEIDVQEGEGDSVYDTSTGWRFVPWMSAGPEDGYRVGGITTFDMIVTAYK